MSKKIFAILSVFALVAFMSTVMAANVKTVATKNGATLYSEADVWSVYVPAAGTVTVKDNKKTYDYTFETDGKYNIGLQKSYTGQLTLVDFEVAVETVTVTFVDPYDSDVMYAEWCDVEIGTEFTWDTSLYAYEDAGYDFYHTGVSPDHIWDLWIDVNTDDLYTYDGSPLVFYGVNTETNEWGSWYAGQEEWIPIKTTFTESVTLTIIMLDTPTPDPVFESAEVTSFNTNLQNANNGNLKFTVTVTMSDGSTSTVDHAETVNGGQSGKKTFYYDDYSVYVAWNDNNKVTTCEVR